MNRREILPAIGAGAAIGLVAGIVGTSSACAAPIAATGISPAVADAIEAHRACVRDDEALYRHDGKPFVDDATAEASDATCARAFLALMAVPCLTPADAAAKAAHILAGSEGLREWAWAEEFMDALIPDGSSTTDPNGPLVTFLRSLIPYA